MKTGYVSFRAVRRSGLATIGAAVFGIVVLRISTAVAQKQGAATDKIKESTYAALAKLRKRRVNGRTLSKAILKLWLREENSFNNTASSVMEKKPEAQAKPQVYCERRCRLQHPARSSGYSQMEWSAGACRCGRSCRNSSAGRLLRSCSR